MEKSPKPFSVNQRVSHYIYGPGTISEINPAHTTIEFDQNGRRKFLTNVVRLEPCDLAPPEPPAKRGRAKPAKSGSKKAN